MSEQPEALRLADGLARALQRVDADDDVIDVARWFVEDSAAELRRLHALNQELLEALESLLWYVGQLETLVYSADDAGEHEEVAKAEGQA
jgi:hypothetical protein